MPQNEWALATGGTIEVMAEPVVYAPADRPEVEVLLDDGTWRYGLLRVWRQEQTGAWLAQVGWSDAASTRIDTFTAERVRRLPGTEPEGLP